MACAVTRYMEFYIWNSWIAQGITSIMALHFTQLQLHICYVLYVMFIIVYMEHVTTIK